jgi:hypothetical protein
MRDHERAAVLGGEPVPQRPAALRLVTGGGPRDPEAFGLGRARGSRPCSTKRPNCRQGVATAAGLAGGEAHVQRPERLGQPAHESNVERLAAQQLELKSSRETVNSWVSSAARTDAERGASFRSDISPNASRPLHRQPLMVAQRPLLQDLHRAVEHHIELVPGIALAEQELAGAQLPRLHELRDSLQVGAR